MGGHRILLMGPTLITESFEVGTLPQVRQGAVRMREQIPHATLQGQGCGGRRKPGTARGPSSPGASSEERSPAHARCSPRHLWGFEPEDCKNCIA